MAPSVADFPVEPSNESDETFYGMDKRPAEWSRLQGKANFYFFSKNLFAFIAEKKHHIKIQFIILAKPCQICVYTVRIFYCYYCGENRKMKESKPHKGSIFSLYFEITQVVWSGTGIWSFPQVITVSFKRTGCLPTTACYTLSIYVWKFRNSWAIKIFAKICCMYVSTELYVAKFRNFAGGNVHKAARHLIK